MFNKEELLKSPNYLLTKYQNEIYRQMVSYMRANNLAQKDVAEKLGVSSAYISQILNGNFNFTLKKLIEIGLMIGKIPALEFVEMGEFWRREREGTVVRPTITININVSMQHISTKNAHFQHMELYTGTIYKPAIAGVLKNINITELESCLN
jgi:predicted XRE-type DNA-binding protein